MKNILENNWYDLYREDFFHYSWKKFIDENSKIIGIGGCFNSNFLRFLNDSGLNVFESVWGLHYNPYTILNELYKVFDTKKSVNLFWNTKNKNNDEILLDALRHPFYANNKSEFIENDKNITKELKNSIKKSNTVLISFALSEIWEQKVNDKWIIINRTPPDDFLKNNEEIFRHRNLKIFECKRYINEIIRLIHNFNKEINIIFMVIPIPLKTSYRRMHPKISDILTKSRLLVALDEIFEKNKNNTNIIYFPVYEIFQYINKNKDGCFQVDYRHLRSDLYVIFGKMFFDFFAKNKNFIKSIDNFNVKQITI